MHRIQQADEIRRGDTVFIQDHKGGFVGPFKVTSIVGPYANLRGPKPFAEFGHFVPGNTWSKK